MRMHWTHTNAMTQGDWKGTAWLQTQGLFKVWIYEGMPPHSEESLTRVVGPEVCVCSSCFHMCWTHLTDESEKAWSPPGTNFSSLFRRPVHYCLQVRTILHSPPTSFAAVCSLSLSFCCSLCTWNTTACHPDFPQCTTACLRSRDWL